MENNIFKNICNEIMRECHNKGIKVSLTFIAYYVKLLIINPTWNISLDNEVINRLDLQALVKYVFLKLSDEFCPSAITLKMQLYFNCSLESSITLILKHRKNLVDRLTPLINEIIEDKSSETQDLENLYKKIVYYLTLKHGLGNPTMDDVYEEAKAALSSVFDMTDLKTFISQEPKIAKQEDLDELLDLLSGIRLFNRDCKKGGAGIEDLPSLLSQAIEVSNNDLQSTLVIVMDQVNILTTAIDSCLVIKAQGPHTTLENCLPEGILDEDMDYAKDLLVCFRQYEVAIRKMLTEIAKIYDISTGIFENFKTILVELHGILQHKTAVPAAQIYPCFTKLATIWRKMQDQVIVLSKINQILVNLQLYIKQISPIDDVIKIMVGSNKILSDAERLDDTAMYRVTQLRCNIPILNPHTIPDFDTVPLQFLGFCAWKFVESDGALIPGNPNIGVAQVNDLYYVFSCIEGAQAFTYTPKKYINGALDVARRKPELTNFLNLYSQLEAVKGIEELVVKDVDHIVTHDVQIQTELYSGVRRIDPDYKWNIWDWKRQAISMADCSKRQTHSTQTEQSSNNNAVRVQTHEMLDKSCQTKKDNYTNVPTLSNYVFGLRGRNDDKQFTITLTRPIDEK